MPDISPLAYGTAPPCPAALEGLRMKEALKCAMLVSKAGNAFFQASLFGLKWA